MYALLLITMYCIFIYGAQTKAIQERAMVTYYDPKYVKNPQAFTARLKRGDSYRSNLTATILHPWGNNVTFSIIYSKNRIGNDRILQVKCCDAYKQLWMEDFIWIYFHRKKACPFPAGSYAVKNLELPPKNYPLPIPKGEFQIFALFALTDSQQVLLKYSLKLKI